MWALAITLLNINRNKLLSGEKNAPTNVLSVFDTMSDRNFTDDRFCPEVMDYDERTETVVCKGAGGANAEYDIQVNADVMCELRKTMAGKDNICY